ncbi:transketolase-like TK C-terminal-containing protein, partial [Arhodomonas sp. AD133]|uniref:transketolase-like TK C-terminal-containing protein n=1 Tax=Arhodomonas sp. AD133 TaxID=3415009 RepID=UPI003EBE0DF2
YRESVLPASVTARVAVEAGVPDSWQRVVGPQGRVVGLDTFGESAPGPAVYEHFGFTAGAVTEAVRALI